MNLVFGAFLAAISSFSLCYALARIAVPLTGVPQNFPPFTALPILSGAVVAPIGAALIFAAIRQIDPTSADRLFFFVTLAVFTLSLGLPLRLSFTKSARFVGVTPAAQITLVLMHAIVTASTFIALTFNTYGH